MKELNPRDITKLQKIYEEMFKEQKYMLFPVWVSNDKRIKIAQVQYSDGEQSFMIEKLWLGSGKFHKKEFKTLEQAKIFAKNKSWFDESVKKPNPWSLIKEDKYL